MNTTKRRLKVAGLFAGIARRRARPPRAGHETALLCENDLGASAVLEDRFPEFPAIMMSGI